jgi:hypothetical protein
VRIIVAILTVEEITAASLRVKIPKQNTKTALSEQAGQVNRSSGFANAPFDIIDGNLFQKLNLITKPQLL